MATALQILGPVLWFLAAMLVALEQTRLSIQTAIPIALLGTVMVGLGLLLEEVRRANRILAAIANASAVKLETAETQARSDD